jgi:DNA-binding response OmpR family regulator
MTLSKRPLEKVNEKKKRILIVDDEEDITISLRTVLESSGFDVDSYTTPGIALAQFKPDLYDLSILDIKMPNMNGFELYKELVKVDNKLKVCFLTALSELHDYDAFKKEVFPRSGQRYYIQKPVENEEILERVNAIVNEQPIQGSPPDNETKT